VRPELLCQNLPDAKRNPRPAATGQHELGRMHLRPHGMSHLLLMNLQKAVNLWVLVYS